MDVAFVRLARKFFRSDLWSEPREYSRAEAWLDMIATATFAPETRLVEGRCVSLQRGELVASLRYLADRWSWSKSRVERFLSTLVDAGRIRDRIETGTKVIILCKYEDYNAGRDASGTATGPPPGHPRDKVKEQEEGKEGDPLLSGFALRGEESQKKDGYHRDTRTALWFLNETCGRSYRETDPNLSVISARLNEKEVTIEGVKAMITRQNAKWKGTDLHEYLRPETLFGKKKFDGYYAARDQPIIGPKQAGPDRNAGLVGGVDAGRADRILARRNAAKTAAQAAPPGVLASEVDGHGADV